jgi:hypothetical protein
VDLEDVEDLRPDQPRGGPRFKISSTLKSGCKYNAFGMARCKRSEWRGERC